MERPSRPGPARPGPARWVSGLNSTLRLPEGAPAPRSDPAAPHPHPYVRLVGAVLGPGEPPLRFPPVHIPGPLPPSTRSSYLLLRSLVKFLQPSRVYTVSLSNRADHLSKDGERVSRNFSAAEAPGSATVSTPLARIPGRRSPCPGAPRAGEPARRQPQNSPARPAETRGATRASKEKLEMGWGSGDWETVTILDTHSQERVSTPCTPSGCTPKAHTSQDQSPVDALNVTPSPGRIHLGTDHPFA